MVSVSQLQDIPFENMILLVGPPGAGKSYFCEQAALQRLAIGEPVIYLTTDCDSSKTQARLEEKGLGEIGLGLLYFIDAYSETVGLSVSDRPNTANADCGSLSTISIALSKLQEQIERRNALLVFDSLTSPYLLSRSEVVRFMRLTLSRFVGEGNSVLACFDEGSSKEEDLVAMMSLSNGVIRLETEDSKQLLKVVKHPTYRPTEIEVLTTEALNALLYDAKIWNLDMIRRLMDAEQSNAQFAVNVFWPSFAYWSSMFWDPKRFPAMNYDVWKEFGNLVKDMIPVYPWHMRVFLKLLMPKNLSKVKDMKKFWKTFKKQVEQRRDGILEYVEDTSRINEHYIRIHENRECWGFENIGTTLSSSLPPLLAGACKGIEFLGGLERDWNAIETRCIGLGDPYCEFKLVPGDIVELRGSLEKDSSILEKIHERLMQRLMEFLIHRKPLIDRPTLGSDFMMAHPDITLPAMAGEKYRMALRMGGAMSGKEIGESLLDVGLSENEAVGRLFSLLEHCKVGKITVDETIRMEDSRESIYIKTLTKKWEEPSCYFATGLLNGFFSIVKNQHVKETKCIAMGDPYCEWEFR
jgi:predicted hydrocarbon binding protein/KaiC/GvpD/RAD55 family RecA-like ATPase